MENNSDEVIRIKIKTIIYVVLIVGFFIGIYLFSLPTYDTYTPLVYNQGGIADSFDILQYRGIKEDSFFLNTNELHWGQMPLTYNYNSGCSSEIYGGNPIKQIEDAHSFISEKTENTITFVYEDTTNPNLMYICDYGEKGTWEDSLYSYTLLGETLNYIYEESKLYSHSEITMYSQIYECSDVLPFVHIHETLHALGLEHPTVAPNIKDIMNENYLDFSKKCDLDIMPKDVKYLISVYGK